MTGKEEIKLVKEVDKLEKEKLKLSISLAKEKAKASANKFNSEFKKALHTAIIAAFSFIMALSWRDVITGYVEKVSSASPIQGQLFGALIICFGFATITGFLGISAPLGAFIAGIFVSNAGHKLWVHESMKSLYILFLALFFVSVFLIIQL